MFKNVVFAVVCSLTLLLGGCEEEGEEGATWLPLECDVEETLTYTRTDEVRGSVREITTTYVSFSAIVDEPAESLLVRVRAPSPNPCAGDITCHVTVDSRVTGEGYYDYLEQGAPTVVGLPDGRARVLCAHTTEVVFRILDENGATVETHRPEATTVLVAEDGDYLVLR